MTNNQAKDRVFEAFQEMCRIVDYSENTQVLCALTDFFNELSDVRADMRYNSEITKDE